MKKIKYRTIYYVLFALITPILIVANSCSQIRYGMNSSEGDFIAYTGNISVLSVVKSSSKIGVIAYSETNNTLTELTTLRAIVESVLIANGFNVGRDDVTDLLTNTNYQLLGLGSAGPELKNKVTDPLSTCFALKKKLFEEAGDTHLLVISMVYYYKYNVSLIDLKNKSVVVSFVINADSQKGWDKFFKPLSNKQWVDYNSDQEGQYYEWGQLANKIVSLLEGRKNEK